MLSHGIHALLLTDGCNYENTKINRFNWLWVIASLIELNHSPNHFMSMYTKTHESPLILTTDKVCGTSCVY